jgi:F0F1-type ATP synthase assembly protein I
MDEGDERAPRREDEQKRTAQSGSPAGESSAAHALRRRADARTERVRGGGSGAGTLAVCGFEFAADLLVFVFLGQWLDRRLGTAPVLLLVCVFVGFAGATFSMYRRLTAAQQREDAARRARNETSKQ